MKHGSLEKAEKLRTKKMVKTNNERYGGNAATCDPKVRKKVKLTVREKYGVDNVSQSPEVMRKIIESTGNKLYARKSTIVAGTKYEALQGYEPDFLKWFYKHYKRKPEAHSVSIPYRHAGKKRRYHPDFAVGKTLIEVKSVYTAGLCKGRLEGYGSYTTMKAKFRGALIEGYRIYLVVWLPELKTAFVHKGALPSREELKRKFKAWRATQTRAP
jgi:hypothetical protein